MATEWQTKKAEKSKIKNIYINKNDTQSAKIHPR